MSRPVLVTDEAAEDVNDAARWYADRSLKVADAFIDEVYTCYKYIELFPNGARRVRGMVRQLPLSRFPLVIPYRPMKDHTVVATGIPCEPEPEA